MKQRLRRVKPRPGRLTVTLGAVLVPVSVLVLLSTVYMFVFVPSTYPIIKAMQAGGIICWVFILFTWRNLYRQGKRRLRGWVVTGARERRLEPTYVAQVSQQFAPNAWQMFFENINDVVYPVPDATGTLVSRRVLAERLYTQPGLINDLYPTTVLTSQEHDLNRLVALAVRSSLGQRLNARRRVLQLHKTGGWLSCLEMQVSYKLHPDTQVDTNAQERCVGALVLRLHLSEKKARRVVDDIVFLHVLLAHREQAAAELTTRARAFDPVELLPFLPGWQKAYVNLLALGSMDPQPYLHEFIEAAAS